MLGVWWVQWATGVIAAAIALLPWLIGGSSLELNPDGQAASTASLLPHAALQSDTLWATLGLCALLAGFIARSLGQGKAKFCILLGLGSMMAWAAAGYQSWTVMAPLAETAGWVRLHLLSLTVGVLLSLILYWVIARMRLSWVALAVAMLSFTPGMWLDLLVPSLPLEIRADYLGPVMLGLVLGALGFSSARSLLIWCAALVMQWILPALLAPVRQILQSPEETLGSAQLWDLLAGHAFQFEWIMLSITTLTVAMLVSMVLLVVRRVRAR